MSHFQMLNFEVNLPDFFFMSFESKGLFDKIVSRLKNVIFEGLMLCVNNCSSKCSDCGYKVRQILMSTAVMVTWFIIFDAVLLISYRSSDSLCSLFVGGGGDVLVAKICFL